MSEILAEIRIRSKNEITIPPSIRKLLKLSPSDILRFELLDNKICICKAVTRKINNKYGEDKNGNFNRN